MADLSHLVEKYFAAAQLEAPQTLVIDSVVAEEVGEDKEMLPVAYFVDERRGLVISAAKYRLLAEAAGTRDVVLWKGLRVVLFADSFTKRGKDIPFVNIEIVKD